MKTNFVFFTDPKTGKRRVVQFQLSERERLSIGRLGAVYEKTAPPTVYDDIGQGYNVSDYWHHRKTNPAVGEDPYEVYRCVDNTNDAAFWVKTSLTLDELGDAATKNVGTAAGTVAAGDHLHDSRYQKSADLPVSVASAMHGATENATPADASELVFADSADSFSLKKLTFTYLFTWFVTKFKAVTSLSGYNWMIDEDNMSSNLDTKVPSQQSVKAYVDTGLGTKAESSHTHTSGQVSGLGDAATKSVGSTSGTVAAGDHNHDSRYLQSVSASNVAGAINGADAKTTPVDADTVSMVDSENSNTLKKLTFANLWSWIETKFKAVTDLTNYSWFVNDDTLPDTNGTKKVPSVAAVKAYVTAHAGTGSGETHYRGMFNWDYDPNTATPAISNPVDGDYILVGDVVWYYKVVDTTGKWYTTSLAKRIFSGDGLANPTPVVDTDRMVFARTGTGYPSDPNSYRQVWLTSLDFYNWVLDKIKALTATTLTWVKSDNTLGGDLTSDSYVPTQKAVKSYVDNAVVGLYDHKGGYDATSQTLVNSPSTVKKGDAYTVTVADTFYTDSLEVGDVLIANQDNPTQLSHWTVVNKNLGNATTSTPGVVQLAANGGTTAGTVVQANDSRLVGAGAPTVYTVNDSNIVAGTIALTLSHRNSVIRVNTTQNAILSLPALSVADFIEIYLDTTAQITVKYVAGGIRIGESPAGGSIVSGGSENFASLTIRAITSTYWGIRGAFGTWTFV